VNLPFPRNDQASTTVKTATAFATTYAFTDSLTNVVDYVDVCFSIVVSDKGTNSSVVVKAQTNVHESTPTVWADMRSDDKILNGAAPLDIYEGTFDVSSLTAPFVLHFNVPRRGRHIRLGIKGTAADGSYTIQAIKNVR
jgi:hypothetical protein